MKEIPEHRQPLLDFLNCLLEQDMGTLFNILEVAKDHLIFESTEENLIFSEFMTTLFIAAKAQGILYNRSKPDYIVEEVEEEDNDLDWD